MTIIIKIIQVIVYMDLKTAVHVLVYTRSCNFIVFLLCMHH